MHEKGKNRESYCLDVTARGGEGDMMIVALQLDLKIIFARYRLVTELDASRLHISLQHSWQRSLQLCRCGCTWHKSKQGA
jgi:hypothetical protein